jgi:hypothetical protein
MIVELDPNPESDEHIGNESKMDERNAPFRKLGQDTEKAFGYGSCDLGLGQKANYGNSESQVMGTNLLVGRGKDKEGTTQIDQIHIDVVLLVVVELL